MSRKKTHDEFVAELKVKNPNVEVVGEYVASHKKVRFRCVEHDTLFEITPSNLLFGQQGCSICQSKKRHEAFAKTHDEFVEEMEKKNPNIIVLGQYVDNRTKIKCLCKKHGVEFSKTPSNLLKPQGCVLCGAESFSLKRKKTHDEFVMELADINPTIIVKGKYVSYSNKILCECSICGHQWYPTPSSLLSTKRKCPMCAKNMKKTHEQFCAALYSVNPHIKVIGNYVNSKTKISCICLRDGHIWDASPDKLLFGRGCPVCKQSNGERACYNYLSSIGVRFITEYYYEDLRGDYSVLHFDFAVLDSSDCVVGLVEYDGEYHFMKLYPEHDFEQQQRYDKLKDEYCETHGIPLLRIPYTQFNNIDTHLSRFCTEIGVLN